MNETIPPYPGLKLRALRTVEAVHQRGSAVAAAQALHVTTSAVSRTLRQTEQALGVTLFERGARGMVCTEPGLAVVRACDTLRHELAHSLSDDTSSEASRRKVDHLMRTLTVPMLRCFVHCAELSSETLTARLLHLSQPAVSQHLRGLRQAYDRVLTQRTPGGTRLTRDGLRALGPARLVLNALRGLHEQLGVFRGDPSGRVHVGVLPMASTVLAPHAIAGLLQHMPAVLVTVSDGTYDAMTQQLRTGDLDFIVGPLRGELAAPDLEERELFREPLIAVVRREHALARHRRTRPLRQLRAYPWIAPLERTPARAAFERAFHAAGVPLPVLSLQANSPALVRAILLRSDHVAFVSPLQIADDLATGQLVQVPVKLQDVERRIGLTLRRGFVPPPACQWLMDALAGWRG